MASSKIEQNDHCKRAEQLKCMRDEIILGKGVAEYDFESGNGVRRRVRYTAADLGRLDAEIAKAENACAIKSGKRGRRFAIAPQTHRGLC